MDAEQGRNLRAERFDRELEGLFAIQDQIASRIVAALKIELEPQVQDRPQHSYVTSIEAYDEFLRGIDFYGWRSRAYMESAMLHFRRAIESGPGFARAYSGLALAHTRLVADALNDGERSVLDQVEQLVEQALKIDQGIPQVYFVQSQIQMYRGDLKGALRTSAVSTSSPI